MHLLIDIFRSASANYKQAEATFLIVFFLHRNKCVVATRLINIFCNHSFNNIFNKLSYYMDYYCSNFVKLNCDLGCRKYKEGAFTISWRKHLSVTGSHTRKNQVKCY